MIVRLTFSENIRWLIHKDNPGTYELQSFLPWVFINPLYYPQIILNFGNNLDTGVSTIINDNALVSKNEMIFATNDSLSMKNFSQKKFKNYTTSFLTSLRHTSKQADLSKARIVAITYGERTIINENNKIKMSELFKPQFPLDLQAPSNLFIHKYLIDTAITWKHLKDADEILVNNSLPIFNTLLLDAILAFIEEDFKRAILYSAMSVETAVKIKLDEAYNSLVQEGDTRGTLRLIAVPQEDKRRTHEDPIYKHLSNTSEFKQLLHLLPLYVLRRSLQIDEQPLYQAALRLYHTRNKIVHQGELPEGSEKTTFTIDNDGAKAAIECAIKVFKWFGVHDEYIIPTSIMINTKNSTEINPSDIFKDVNSLQGFFENLKEKT